MSLIIKSFILGPIQNNTYLVTDEQTGHAAIVDPAAPSKEISSYIEKQGWKLKYIWIFAAVASMYGAIAGAFFDKTPLTAVAFGLLAIVFALAAYRDMSGKT